MPVAIPTSTREVLAGSRFRLEAETFLWVKVRAVGHPERHRLIHRDEREITVVTTAEGLADLDVIETNRDRWALFTVDCANPFYCVGFLAAIADVLVARGVDILVISTFSRDLVFVAEAHVESAREALVEVGLKPAGDVPAANGAGA